MTIEPRLPLERIFTFVPSMRMSCRSASATSGTAVRAARVTGNGVCATCASS